MRGLADGAGVEYDLVVRVHMLPELVKVVGWVFLILTLLHLDQPRVCV